jgi:hypothetical protein
MSNFYIIPPELQKMRSQELADILGIGNMGSVNFATRVVVYQYA